MGEGGFDLSPLALSHSRTRAVQQKPNCKVLIVCHANTSRSIMAHAVLDKMLTERGIDHIDIRSGGIAIYARDGMLPSLDARLVLREVDIYVKETDFSSTDLKRHRHLIEQAHLILTMTHEQKQMLDAYPEATGKRIFTLREFAGEEGDIDDPAMQGEEAFRARLTEIKRCLEKSLDELIRLSYEDI
jgi:protein-tyrosine-phosphatase